MNTKVISDSLVVLGDSFTDYSLSWANVLGSVIDMPVIKFTVPGASNKTILDNFYAKWYYENLKFKNCLVIFQSTHVRREDLDISPGSYGYDFFTQNDLFKYLDPDETMPYKTHEIYGRKYVLSGFKRNIPWITHLWPHSLNANWQESVRFLCFQTNLLAEAFSNNGNKFLFLLGLHNNKTAQDMDFSEHPVNCEYAAYIKDGRAYGIDQYVLDIDQIDETTHPSIEGHKSIVNNIVLPKLSELQWLPK